MNITKDSEGGADIFFCRELILNFFSHYRCVERNGGHGTYGTQYLIIMFEKTLFNDKNIIR